jgi:hypothetical protein
VPPRDVPQLTWISLKVQTTVRGELVQGLVEAAPGAVLRQAAAATQAVNMRNLI